MTSPFASTEHAATRNACCVSVPTWSAAPRLLVAFHLGSWGMRLTALIETLSARGHSEASHWIVDDAGLQHLATAPPPQGAAL